MDLYTKHVDMADETLPISLYLETQSHVHAGYPRRDDENIKRIH